MIYTDLNRVLSFIMMDVSRGTNKLIYYIIKLFKRITTILINET